MWTTLLTLITNHKCTSRWTFLTLHVFSCCVTIYQNFGGASTYSFSHLCTLTTYLYTYQQKYLHSACRLRWSPTTGHHSTLTLKTISWRQYHCLNVSETEFIKARNNAVQWILPEILVDAMSVENHHERHVHFSLLFKKWWKKMLIGCLFSARAQSSLFRVLQQVIILEEWPLRE